MFAGRHLHKNESRIIMIMFIHLKTHISSNFVNGGHSTCFPVQCFNCIMGNYQKNAIEVERGAVAFTVDYMYLPCICTCNR